MDVLTTLSVRGRPVELRRATEGDLPALVGLLAACALWATTVRHLLVDAAARSELRQQGTEAAS